MQKKPPKRPTGDNRDTDLGVYGHTSSFEARNVVRVNLPLLRRIVVTGRNSSSGMLDSPKKAVKPTIPSPQVGLNAVLLPALPNSKSTILSLIHGHIGDSLDEKMWKKAIAESTFDQEDASLYFKLNYHGVVYEFMGILEHGEVTDATLNKEVCGSGAVEIIHKWESLR